MKNGSSGSAQNYSGDSFSISLSLDGVEIVLSSDSELMLGVLRFSCWCCDRDS